MNITLSHFMQSIMCSSADSVSSIFYILYHSLSFGPANSVKMWFCHSVHITFVIAQVKYQY